MLVLSRKVGERILIGRNISIMVVGVEAGSRVRLGIDAPPGVRIDREEIAEARGSEGRGERSEGHGGDDCEQGDTEKGA